MTDAKIRLLGITKFDRLELESLEGIEFEEVSVDAGMHGEVTLFTATVTYMLISTVAAYLLRKHQEQTFEEEVEIVHADGRVERRTIKWTGKSSEAPEAEIIRQIRGDLG